jgi:hypothetical protein
VNEHTCPISGCTTSVAAAYPLCAEHERILPTDLRAAVERAYNRNQPLEQQAPGFQRALANASSWIVATYGVQTERTKPSWAALKAATRRKDAERNARLGKPAPPSFDPADTRTGKFAGPRSAEPEREPEPEQPAPPGQMRLL